MLALAELEDMSVFYNCLNIELAKHFGIYYWLTHHTDIIEVQGSDSDFQ